MMTRNKELSKYLDPLGLSAWRFYPEVESTNDIALEWAKQGAPDGSLVVADAQTAGRGRAGRHWVTEPGGSLAFSLVLRPSPAEAEYFPRFTALAALGLINALSRLGLRATLKWPNDVLLTGCKVAGVLVEADWQADKLKTVVIGVGVNISPKSVPQPGILRYPATAVESVLGSGVDRWALLSEILRGMRNYRAVLVDDAFIDAWNNHLAWRDAWVRFRLPGEKAQVMKVLGVQSDGRLVLEDRAGQQMKALTGEILMTADKH